MGQTTRRESHERGTRGHDPESDQPSIPEEWGWYLYGIVLGGERSLGAQPEGLTTVEERELAALVARVPVAEYGAQALRQRLQDAAWLEAAVRRHDQVIAAIHEERTILPAKFGCVYASLSDLHRVLEETHDELKERIARLAGCDEWGVHVYVVPAEMRRQALAEDPKLKRLRHELRAASPGRAYFLERKLAEVLSSATEQRLADLAQTAHDRLSGQAVASSVEATEHYATEADPDREMEILRSAYLVRREQKSAFLAELEALAATGHFEHSGPWPPYSFAAQQEQAL